MRGNFRIELRHMAKRGQWRVWVYYPKATSRDGLNGWVNYDADSPEAAVSNALDRLKVRMPERARLRPTFLRALEKKP